MLTCKDTCTCFTLSTFSVHERSFQSKSKQVTVHVHRPAILSDISIIHRFSRFCATRCFQLAATVHYYCTRGTYLKQETHGPIRSPGLLLFLINKES